MIYQKTKVIKILMEYRLKILQNKPMQHILTKKNNTNRKIRMLKTTILMMNLTKIYKIKTHKIWVSPMIIN